jgi:hypothetical protein
MKKFVSRAAWGLCLSSMILYFGCNKAGEKTQARPETAVPADKTQAGAKSPAVLPGEPVLSGENGLLTADKTVYDFGTVDPGSRLEGAFVLKNTGAKAMEIADTRSSCGCTVPSLEKKELETGQTTELKFVYNVGPQPGKSAKKITVMTKPPAQPDKLELTVMAEIRKFIDITPESLKFELHPSRPVEFTVVLESTDKAPFKITNTTFNSTAITLQYDKDLQAPVHNLTVKIDPNRRKELKNGSLAVDIDHSKTKRVYIPYQAVAPFIVSPGARYFNNLTAGQENKSTVTVTSSFSEPFELGAVSSEKGLIKVLKVEKVTDGYQLEIGANPAPGSTELKDQLNIPIKDHPDDTLKVICYGKVGK